MFLVANSFLKRGSVASVGIKAQVSILITMAKRRAGVQMDKGVGQLVLMKPMSEMRLLEMFEWRKGLPTSKECSEVLSITWRL